MIDIELTQPSDDDVELLAEGGDGLDRPTDEELEQFSQEFQEKLEELYDEADTLAEEMAKAVRAAMKELGLESGFVNMHCSCSGDPWLSPDIEAAVDTGPGGVSLLEEYLREYLRDVVWQYVRFGGTLADVRITSFSFSAR